jgi:DNA invertase Pin-like site-specific DNA recombinase
MVEANQAYHPQLSEQSRAQIVRTIIAMAMFEARKEIKRKIQSEGRVKLCRVPVREIERLAKLMVMERRDEFIAKAKASGVVQDELRRLQAKEERKRQRQLERNPKTFEQFANACGARTSVERMSCTKRRGEMIVGYARVSTDGQSHNAQQAALREAGAQRVFSEKQSGAMTDRAALARCLASLETGDTLLVTKLDRLARSTRDLLNTLAAVAERGASFKSLGDGWADTTTPHGKLMLTVLGGLAEFERHLILSRTDEGRFRAKARGVTFGRKPKLTNISRRRPEPDLPKARPWSRLRGATTSAT